jgi:hypothetical protein
MNVLNENDLGRRVTIFTRGAATFEGRIKGVGTGFITLGSGEIVIAMKSIDAVIFRKDEEN